MWHISLLMNLRADALLWTNYQTCSCCSDTHFSGRSIFMFMQDIYLGAAASELEYSVLVLVLLTEFFIYGGGK